LAYGFRSLASMYSLIVIIGLMVTHRLPLVKEHMVLNLKFGYRRLFYEITIHIRHSLSSIISINRNLGDIWFFGKYLQQSSDTQNHNMLIIYRMSS
jgi:hypothetical protein